MQLGYLHGGAVQTVQTLPRTDPAFALDGAVLVTQPDTGTWWTAAQRRRADAGQGQRLRREDPVAADPGVPGLGLQKLQCPGDRGVVRGLDLFRQCAGAMAHSVDTAFTGENVTSNPATRGEVRAGLLCHEPGQLPGKGHRPQPQ